MDETKKLVRHCYELSFDNLPDEAIDRVKYLVLDYLGVAVRGSLTESARPVQQLVKDLSVKADGAPIFGTALRAGAPFAAMANGTASHSIELDDVVNSASLHPAVAIMSAALSAGLEDGCSGRELIEAIVAGYEVMIRLGTALDPSAHYARGFHPTGTCGTMGAAITAARLLKLDEEGIKNALGIAGSQAAGSMEFLSDGSFTKRLHPGWAAHSGIIAALLAQKGFTGPGTVIEGKSGFLHAYSLESKPELVLKDWGAPYEVMRTSIKPHACCRYKQGPIDCLLKIVEENRLIPSDIDRIIVGVLKAGFAIISEPEEQKRRPQSIVDAQFSMPFGAAVAILKRKAGLDDYTLDNVRSAEFQSIMDRVECVQDPELEKEFPRKWPASVRVDTKDGRTFEARIDYPKGDPENPLSWDEIIDKFNGLARAVLPEEKVLSIVDKVRRLEGISDIDELIPLLMV